MAKVLDFFSKKEIKQEEEDIDIDDVIERSRSEALKMIKYQDILRQYLEEILNECESYYSINSDNDVKKVFKAAEITELLLELNDSEFIEELKNRIFYNKSTRCIQNKIMNKILEKNNL